MRYYKVTVQRGHMGTGYDHGVLTFYYRERNLIQAIKRAKRQPGVKHDRLPLNACECSREEYEANICISAYKRGMCKGWNK